jgi:hypothetical protein
VVITIRTSSPAVPQAQTKAWLEGNPNTPINLPARGLLHGLKKCHGMLGFSIAPTHERFELVLALPT